jgi:hypothetical protein
MLLPSTRENNRKAKPARVTSGVAEMLFGLELEQG